MKKVLTTILVLVILFSFVTLSSTTSGTVKSGDSGGPVYYTTTSGVIACGVLSGVSSTIMAFCPLELVSSFSVNIG